MVSIQINTVTTNKLTIDMSSTHGISCPLDNLIYNTTCTDFSQAFQEWLYWDYHYTKKQNIDGNSIMETISLQDIVHLANQQYLQ